MAELADGMLEARIMDAATHQKITQREISPEQAVAATKPIDPKTIRALRERAHLSQAAFGLFLNLTAGYISKLERGSVIPAGATLALLNVIRRKGINAIE
jgi:putative transcriptional regulator